MRIEVASRSEEDGIVSFKPETAAERLQLEHLLAKGTELGLNVFRFTGWDDDDGGITFVTKLK